MLFHTRRCYPRSICKYFGGILLLLLLFTSCKGVLPSVSQATPTAQQAAITPLTNLISPHMLTVGIYANYFPQEYTDASGHQILGFDIDVIQSISTHLHLRTRLITEDYSMLINDLATNRFDVVVSAVSITPELQKKVDFIPYFKGGESLLVVKDNPSQIDALSDLCGQKVGIKEGTIEQSELKDVSAICLKDGKVAVSTIVYAQYTDGLQLLIKRNIAAIYQDAPVSDYFIKQYSDRFEIAGGIIGANLEGIAVRKDNAPLLSTLQKTFARMKADGSYRSMIVKWGLMSGDITTNEARAEPGPALASFVDLHSTGS